MADTLQNKPVNQRIIRDRLAAWESKTNSKASLTDKQKDSIIELTTKASERVIPEDLPEDEAQFALSKKQDVPQSPSYHETITKFFQTNEDDSPCKIENAQQFLSWFAELENDIEKEDEDTYRSYITELQHYESQCESILQEVSGALDFLNGLQHQYISVSTKTNALHEACEDLLTEQTRLMNTAENISNKLSYFNEYDRITAKLGLPSLTVTNESFVPMLSRLDECILYLNNNPRYKESPVFLTRFRQCLSKALNLIKTHVVQILQNATQQVQPTKESPSIGDNAFTLFYGKFRANSTRVKALMEQLEIRIDKSPEYLQILSDCHQCYFNQRELLLGPSISTTITDLASKHVRDHCTLMRSGCAFMVHVCEDEYQLYFNFFSKPTSLLDDMLERLCSHLYDTLRPLIIHINHLETLSELCSILKIEMLEEHVLNNAQELKAFEIVCRQMLMDIQERFVYRTYIYIKSDILSYTPAQGDLAYPEKLEMMESIAESIKNESKKGHRRSGSNASSTTGHSRSGSTVSATSQEVADITTNGQVQETSFKEIDISSDSGRTTPMSMPMSPADLHGMWYPTVRRTLVTLSKLYRCIDRTTFQGLSQEALQSCIASLKIAKEGIIKRKTKTDGQLFLVKHLLILREQIAPFHADFTIRETSLDFSKFKDPSLHSILDAAYGLMHSKSKLFQFNSNNAVLQFILEGTPQVTEYFVDSKRDVDQELKKTCEEYIHYVTELFISPLQMFLSRANVVISMKSEENIKSVSLSSQPFATPEKIHDIVAETYKNMKTQLVSVHRSMALYLANRDTEIILFKPVKVNIQNSFQQLYKILDEYYTEEDQQIVATPSIEQINLLLSTSAKN
ncbi:conserved oligomeric Golgi complex subunit 3-like isoform X2 [Mytilus galloprovincialis]|uniref:conserved oligomeric Golgi complex subunit 3-like isoform X2 n=1 Tax=Mytilus galloprovincialis TaxID=29158 RepID=UPI003F7C7BF2